MMDVYCDEHELGWVGQGCPLCLMAKLRTRLAEAEAELAKHEKCVEEMTAEFEKSLDECLDRAEAAEQRRRAQDWKWICEFCYARLYVNTLPKSWEWVWQSAVCPECRVRVKQNGGYSVVKGGAYAEVPDPRALTPGALSAPPPGE